ncbi:class I SAM-dependent DNA methyltransferase [Clostridium polynesiense]|uniref:class I SAM-dependent DNA methyltransferase n=1 Tax=Clostridium polynesiense TaxID=1325933 RepID=UPI00058B6C6E|nr:class I SAM-dependent methyltransferase [Clostridium polynesiense]
MSELRQNYYGNLCTEMYEILHEKAPQDELDFYISYAEKDKKILEALCGSGRFLVPFIERGFDIYGMDLSSEMLHKLKQKAPDAKVIQTDILEYSPIEKFDYIFISSGSVSLFTDIKLCKQILAKIKEMLTPKGKFVFAVETMGDRCIDDDGYKETVSVKTKDGFDLILKSKNYYDEQSQTQFMPGIYELYNGTELLQSESMDFQIHLYKFGEMEQYLKEIGFTNIKTYSSFFKDIAIDDKCEMFLFECSVIQ